MGTYGRCTDRYDPKTNTFKHYTKGDAPNQLNNDAVYAIFEDSRGKHLDGYKCWGRQCPDPGHRKRTPSPRIETPARETAIADWRPGPPPPERPPRRNRSRSC